MLATASPSACEYRQRLEAIVTQRHAAVCSGASAADLTALDRQVSACRVSFIGAAVTEIATLRAVLGAPNHG
jgi:hypothetical protein